MKFFLLLLAFIKEELQDAKLLQDVANLAAAAASGQAHNLQLHNTANGSLPSLASPMNQGQPPIDSLPLLNAFNMPVTSAAQGGSGQGGRRGWQTPQGGNVTPVTSHPGKAATPATGARNDSDSPPQETEIVPITNSKVTKIKQLFCLSVDYFYLRFKIFIFF